MQSKIVDKTPAFVCVSNALHAYLLANIVMAHNAVAPVVTFRVEKQPFTTGYFSVESSEVSLNVHYLSDAFAVEYIEYERAKVLKLIDILALLEEQPITVRLDYYIGITGIMI